MSTNIPKEKWRDYIAAVESVERYRDLSDEEKEMIARRILSKRYLDLRCDWAFKYVMQNNEVLTMLLRDFISEDIDHVEMLPNEIGRLSENDKNIIMDVLCRTKSGQKFIVEMQRDKKTSFQNRMFYYGASMLHSQLLKKDDYNILMPVYVICFMDFRLKHDTDQLVYRYMMKERDSGEVYNNLLTICLCELPRLKARKIDGMNDIESWFYILENIHNFAGDPGDFGKRFTQVMELAQTEALPDNNKLKYLQAMVSENERLDIGRAYFEDGLEEGFAKGKAEGKAEGLAEGKAEGKAEGLEDMAKALAKMGMSEAEIKKALELAKNS